MFSRMRVGRTLRDKALLALEEALQECRYGPVRRTQALRFALAYLHRLQDGDRAPFDRFWIELANGNAVHRFGYADSALAEIHRRLGVPRDEEAGFSYWRAAQARAGAVVPGGETTGRGGTESAG